LEGHPCEEGGHGKGFCVDLGDRRGEGFFRRVGERYAVLYSIERYVFGYEILGAR
jgi:hypothetical protein